MWAASPKMPETLKIEQRYIDIDADAGTTAYHFTGDLKEVEFLKYDVTTLAYHLPNRERAVVIGVGGGRDMLSAAVFGLPDITGVEINPILVKLLTEKRLFADFTNIRRFFFPASHPSGFLLSVAGTTLRSPLKPVECLAWQLPHFLRQELANQDSIFL